MGAVASFVLPLVTAQLRYPGWFAVQRADLVLAPALVGWYWSRRRPGSPFAWLLVLLGLLAVPVSLEAARSPWLHLIGVVGEAPLLYATFAVILAFPTGRLGRVDRGVLLVLFVSFVAWYVPYYLLAPVAPGSPLAVCRAVCPANPLQIANHPAFLATFADVYSAVAVAVTVAVAGLILVRLVRADPPRRRALLIGSLIALTFLAAFGVYVAANLFTSLLTSAVGTPVRWLLPASRAALPVGYLLALIDSELYAGRLMVGTVDRALRDSSALDVLDTMRRALGDPQLAFGFWVAGRGWLRANGRPLAQPDPGSSRVMTTVNREGRAVAAVVHRAQLEESPELMSAAVAASLLILEKATLEAELNAAISELQESRARIITAGDAERRRIERDLHDGAQQRLIALRMKLAASGERPAGDGTGRGQLADLCADVDRVLAEIRELAQGIFPALLSDLGLAAALEAAARDSPLSVRVESAVLPARRYALELEAALYFCGVEALQNATKHAGADADVTVTLSEVDGELCLWVRDDGAGFDASERHAGTGLAGMRDRLGAFGGRLTIDAAPGRGTMVCGTVPIAPDGGAANVPASPGGLSVGGVL
ncbi:MAG TPA: histidine kinase [Solirubrobacteraceae bacterium]|nr:histidine kinase [Solirubrobacteraceae bacterium]